MSYTEIFLWIIGIIFFSLLVYVPRVGNFLSFIITIFIVIIFYSTLFGIITGEHLQIAADYMQINTEFFGGLSEENIARLLVYVPMISTLIWSVLSFISIVGKSSKAHYETNTHTLTGLLFMIIVPGVHLGITVLVFGLAAEWGLESVGGIIWLIAESVFFIYKLAYNIKKIKSNERSFIDIDI